MVNVCFTSPPLRSGTCGKSGPITREIASFAIAKGKCIHFETIFTTLAKCALSSGW
jgi:hypothetical protein